MKIPKIIKEDPMWTDMLSTTETRRVADLLEQSKDFEEKIRYLRNKYNIPDTGYPYPEDPKDYPKYAMEVILDGRTQDLFFDEAIEINKTLNLPRYWWGSIAYFAFYNVFITPEREDPIGVEYMNFKPDYRSGTHIIIKEKMSKSQIHKWIDESWKNIVKEMKALPEAKGHKMQRSEIAKEIVRLRDEEKKSYKDIAENILPKKYPDREIFDILNEDYVKILYHRWKRRSKLKK